MFNLRIRFILLRAICLSAIVSICELIPTWSFWSEWRDLYYLSAVLAPVTFAHHFLRSVSSRRRNRLTLFTCSCLSPFSVHSVLVSASRNVWIWSFSTQRSSVWVTSTSLFLQYLYINFFNIGTSLFMRVTGVSSNRWSSQSTVFYVTVWWILLVSLAAYGLLRTLEVFKRRGRGLFKKFVIYKTDDGALDPDCTSGIYVLTGRAIWKHHIS